MADTAATNDNGLEIVFKYAHHSDLLPELDGLNLLHKACNEVNVARYVQSAPNPRGYTPTTPPAGSSGGGGDENINTNNTDDGGVGAVVAADLSPLDQVMAEEEEGQTLPVRVLSLQPRKPATPELGTVGSRLPMPPGERGSNHSTANPRSTGFSNGEYVYQARSTHGAALAFVFHGAMREQARQKITAARDRKVGSSVLRNAPSSPTLFSTVTVVSSSTAATTTAGATSPDVLMGGGPTPPPPLLVSAVAIAVDAGGVPAGIASPFFGLKLLHSACLQLKQEEPHKFLRFPHLKWNSNVTRHQHERFLMGGGGIRRRGGEGGRPPLAGGDEDDDGDEDVMIAFSPLDATLRENEPHPPPPSQQQSRALVEVPQVKRPPQARRVTTAQRIARRAQNLKTSLTEIKTMIDVRAVQAKQQPTLVSGATLRTRRLKKFASTLPKPKSSSNTKRRQSQQGPGSPAGSLGGTQQVGGFLPVLAGTYSSGELAGANDTMNSVGGDKGRIRLPGLNSNRTQGDGNNCPEGGRVAALENSRAGQLVRRFEKGAVAPTTSTDDGGSLGDAQLPSPKGQHQGGGGPPLLKGIQHRFTSGTSTHLSQQQRAALVKTSEGDTARRLMM